MTDARRPDADDNPELSDQAPLASPGERGSALDYLWEVFGGLVPLQIVAAAVVAWITAR